jgi:hypothetical protein
LHRSAGYQSYLEANADLALEVATQYGNIDPQSDEEDLGEDAEEQVESLVYSHCAGYV